MTPAAASRVGRNSFYSGIGFVASSLGLLLFTPLLLPSLGTERYGLWLLSTSFLGIVSVFDLGLSVAVGKYVAQYSAEEDIGGVSATVTMGVVLYMGLGVLLSLAAFLAAPALGSLIDGEGASAQTVDGVFRVAAFGLLPLLLKNAAVAVPIGLQRFETPMIISVLQSLLPPGFALLASWSGGSIAVVVASTVASLWLIAAVAMTLAVRMLLVLGARVLWSPPHLRRIARFLAFTGTAALGQMLFTSMDRIAVGAVLGLSAVTYYAVSIGVAVNLLRVADVLSAPLMPAASAWQGRSELDRVRRWLFRATVATGVMEGAVAVVLLLVSRPFLTLWLGPEFASHAIAPFRILVAVYAMIAISAPSWHIANGLGRPWVPAVGALSGGALTIGLIFLMAPLWGVSGAAVANAGYWGCSAGVMAYMMVRPWRKDLAAPRQSPST